MSELALKHGLSFSDLYERDGLIRLDRAFVAHLAAAEVALHDRLMAARAAPDAVDRKAESELLVDLSPHLEDFVGELFGIAHEVRALQAAHDELAPLYSVKRLFVQRRAVKEVREADAAQLNGHKLAQELETLIGGPPADFTTRQGVLAGELRYAEGVARWLDDEAAHKLPLKVALEYAAWATLSPEGRAKHRRGLLFRVPHRLEMMHVEPVRHPEQEPAPVLRSALRRQRRPGGVFERHLERQLVRRLVVEPARHPFGIAQFAGEHPLARGEISGRAADQRLQLLRQLVAIELGGVGLLHLLDGAALHKEALHRKKRRQLVVRSLQRADLMGDAEQLADKIFEMGRQIDEEVGFRLAVDRIGRGARRHQPIVQRHLARREMRDKGAVEPNQPDALVKIGKTEPVLQGEFGHGRSLRHLEIANHPANRRDRAAPCSQLHNKWRAPHQIKAAPEHVIARSGATKQSRLD